MDQPILRLTRAAEDDTASSSFGTNLGSASGANTKGSWTTLVASAPFDVAWILCTMQVDINVAYLVDVGVGSGPTVKVPNIPFGTWGAGGDTHSMVSVFLPISIPKGTQISARMQASNSGTPTRKFKMQLFADGQHGIQPPKRWVDWGTTTSTSKGTTATTGNSVTKGSWVQLTSATDFDTRWLLLSFIAGSVDDMSVDIGVGGSGSEVVKIPDIHVTNESMSPFVLLIPMHIPKSTRLSARIQAGSNGSTLSIQVLGGG